MKRILPFLLVLILFAFSAHAEEIPSGVQHAMANLTEVYGYTQEEAEAFIFQCTESDLHTRTEFYPPGHPTWLYLTVNDKTTGQYISGTTPFYVSGFMAYPGESTVRDGLRAARENGWFTDLSTENRSAFLKWMERWAFRANDILHKGLTTGDITAAQAIHAYFTSCYGDPSGWPEALREWHDEELASYGLETEVAALPLIASDGVKRYETQVGNLRTPITVTEFAGEVPEEIAQALSHPKLAGWTCLSGAYRTVKPINEKPAFDSGLLALEKDGARLLVTIHRLVGTEAWTVMPVGEKALLSSGKLYITFEASASVFALTYRISDTETESFRVRMQYYSNETNLLCQLEEYRYINAATGERVVITAADGRSNAADAGKWYHVVTTTGGKTTEEQITVLIAPYLNYIDADAFPKTAEACRADTGYTLPDKYGVSSSVHLRAKTSSRSADLGTYNNGTTLQILGLEPGDPFAWYHVRIGSVEGYMCSLYVDYPGSDCAMAPLLDYAPLPVARTKKDVKLKKGTGLFDGAVTTLPAGTKMHVLAENGGWLHVMVPLDGEPGWLMDIDGTDGYVKADDVLIAATSLQLDWLD